MSLPNALDDCAINPSVRPNLDNQMLDMDENAPIIPHTPEALASTQ
jgi:hypothetical protein